MDGFIPYVNTIATFITRRCYEQVAVDLTAWVARSEPDPYLKQAYQFGLLEDFDHLYRYSALMDRLMGKDASNLLQMYTDIVPGRPTSVEHRAPIDDLRKPYDKKKASPVTKLNALTIMSGEQQTRNYYMNIGPWFADPLARQLYAEAVRALDDWAVRSSNGARQRRETRWVTGVSKRLGGSGDPSPVTAYGVFQGLRACAEEALDRSVELGVARSQGVGLVNGVASALLALERLAQAREKLYATPAGEDLVGGRRQALIAQLAALEGDWAASQRALDEFSRLLPRDTTPTVEYLPHYYGRMLLLLHGPGDRLAETVGLVLEGEREVGLLSRVRFSFSGLTTAARAAWQLRRRDEPGDRELADRLAEELAAVLAREDWPVAPVGELTRQSSRGFLEEDPARALEHWDRALPLAERAKGVARGECLYGAFWAVLETGEVGRARELLGQAEGLLAELDLHIVRQFVDGMRAALAEAAPAPAVLPAGLTPREAEVLAEVAKGLSNREVGEALFISAKTVSVHVTNLMAKLGARNRTTAVARARDLGLV